MTPKSVSPYRKNLVGIIPFHGNDMRFQDRIINWSNFISGNKLRNAFHTSLVIPKQYSQHLSATVINAFEIIKTVEGSQYMALIESRYKVDDYLSGIGDDGLDIACFLFAANEPILKSAYPHAVTLHFEAGMLSRGSLPQLVQYDPIGLYKYGALNELQTLTLPECASALCGDMTNCARSAMKRLTNNTNLVVNNDLMLFASKFDKIALLALPKEGDLSIAQFVGRPITCQELLNMFARALPSSVGIVATLHPAENLEGFNKDFVIDNQDRIIIIPTGGQIASSDFFSVVDTIIVVNSMTGAQAKLAGLKMICSENHPLRVLSDSVFTVEKEQINIRDNSSSSDIDATLGYILSYLHLPPTIWNAGYGAVYINHFLRGGKINTLHENRACYQYTEIVRNYYEDYLR